MVFTKAFSLGEKVAKISDFCRMWGKKACYARHFDLLRNSHSTVPPVRRRVRVACLDGSFDLCQSVKKEFFDRLGADAHIGPVGDFFIRADVGIGPYG